MTSGFPPVPETPQPARTAPGAPVTPGYPANMVVAGRDVLMVGAGAVAARKVEALLTAGARVRVGAPRVCDEIRAWRDDGLLSVDVRPFQTSDLDGAWLVFTAADDPAVNRAVFDEGELRRLFVNSADDPANCSFTLMSVVRRGEIQVAIGTAGRSPALAAYLRRRLQDELGPEYEVLLSLLAEAREEIRADGRSTEDLDWRGALDSDILDLVRAGRVDEAKERLRTCLSSSSG